MPSKTRVGIEESPPRPSKTREDRDENKVPKVENKLLQQVQVKSRVERIIKPVAEKQSKIGNKFITLITQLTSMLDED